MQDTAEEKEVSEENREKMREWLSGGVSPCQGEGRGFESRLALDERKCQELQLENSWHFLCTGAQ